jgi:Receptor L domain
LAIETDIASFDGLKHCRIMDGSLTITDIKDQRIRNLSFPLLVEVTSYMKIHRTDYLLSIGDLFPNLVVIRGKNLTEKTALEVSDNTDLIEIGLSSLRFIGNGNVVIRNNKNLCFSNTIDWSVIAPKSTENYIEASLNLILE